MSVQSWEIQQSAPIDGEQFELWRALLEERTGMVLTEDRKPYLEASLNIRMREIGIDSHVTYFQHLVGNRAADMAAEWATLIDRLTVQETSFFRHAPSYQLVKQEIQQCLKKEQQQLQIWSVGCSTGEEPYSLAMLMEAELEGSTFRPYWGITASDISLPALSTARKGVYHVRRLTFMPPEFRDKYLVSVGVNESQIKKNIKRNICFVRVNVLELEQTTLSEMDVIFCQNMLIYFRRWRKRQIVNKFVERLRVGGLLVLGLGEISGWQHPQMKRVDYDGTLAYRRVK